MTTLGRFGAPPSVPDRTAADWLPAVVVIAVNLALAMILGSLGAIHPLLGVGIALAALLVIAVALRPDLATLLFLVLLYSNAGAIAVQRDGLPFVIAAAFPALLLIPLAYHLVARREAIIVTPALRLIVVLFLWELLSTILSSDVSTSMERLGVFALEGVLLVALVTNVLRDITWIRRATWILLFVGAAVGTLSGIQQLTGDYDNDFFGFAQVSRAVIATGDVSIVGELEQPRLAGMIGEKNKYAQAMIVLLPLAYFRFRDERRRALRLLALVLAGLITVGTVLSFSRGAALGFVAVVAVMVVLRYVKVRQVAAVILAAGLVLAVFPTYAERVVSLAAVTEVDSGTGGSDPSIESRLTENIASLLAVADHPILGVGPGLFPSYYRRYADEVAIRVLHEDREAHNLYLGQAAETGIPGLILFLGIFWVVMRPLERERRRWLSTRPEIAGLAAGIILALVAYLATGIFLHLAYERYLWLLIAMGAATAWIAERTDEGEASPAWAAAATAHPLPADANGPRSGRFLPRGASPTRG